jgi:hypothetical protein
MYLPTLWASLSRTLSPSRFQRRNEGSIRIGLSGRAAGMCEDDGMVESLERSRRESEVGHAGEQYLVKVAASLLPFCRLLLWTMLLSPPSSPLLQPHLQPADFLSQQAFAFQHAEAERGDEEPSVETLLNSNTCPTSHRGWEEFDLWRFSSLLRRSPSSPMAYPRERRVWV